MNIAYCQQKCNGKSKNLFLNIKFKLYKCIVRMGAGTWQPRKMAMHYDIIIIISKGSEKNLDCFSWHNFVIFLSWCWNKSVNSIFTIWKMYVPISICAHLIKHIVYQMFYDLFLCIPP